MRQLIIKTQKSFVKTDENLYVYISSIDGDTIIKGQNCKLIGKITDKESKFEIEDGKGLVFVVTGEEIVDKKIAIQEINNEQGNVVLRGCVGRLQGVPAYAFLYGLQYGNKISPLFIILMVITIIGGFLFFYFVQDYNKNASKVFVTNTGFKITLTNSFKESDREDSVFYALNQRKDLAVQVTKFSKETIESLFGKFDSEKDLVVKILKLNEDEVKTTNGHVYGNLVKTFENEGVTFDVKYYSFIEIHGDDVWFIEFFYNISKEERSTEKNIFKWIDSVEISK